MRTKLNPRRRSTTLQFEFVYQEQHTKKILITIGYDDSGAPKEVFCADFKAGTTLHSIVQDACILLSRLLQHGDTLDELAESLCSQPQSLIGQMVAQVRAEGREEPWEGFVLLRPSSEAELAE